MFKRVDKRRRKKEEEEKLGLDEEVKEILGIQDTDSEESESESDFDEGEEEGSAAEGERDEEEDEGEDPSVTVSQALKDPVYIVSILPDVKACIVCPGKLLKSVKMVQLHRTSNAHIRRFKQFSDGSVDARPNDSAWDILKRHSETKPKLSLSTSGASRRAEKKKASQARRKARREEAKEKAKAKKSKVTSDSPLAQPSDASGSTKPNSPLKKKRKIDKAHQVLSPTNMSTIPAPSAPPPATKKHKKKESAITESVTEADSAAAALEDGDDDAQGPPKVQDSVKIQDIVKSTSNRAKSARSRALSMSKSTSRLTKSAVA
ncbi:hypothetical protein BYT27DRAFT_7230935 [Phlegmacium glaucopus]|nr:hypothetical protein BYT27DRAFT_7230935 [Phlegmacium glaucopus]